MQGQQVLSTSFNPLRQSLHHQPLHHSRNCMHTHPDKSLFTWPATRGQVKSQVICCRMCAVEVHQPQFLGQAGQMQNKCPVEGESATANQVDSEPNGTWKCCFLWEPEAKCSFKCVLTVSIAQLLSGHGPSCQRMDQLVRAPGKADLRESSLLKHSTSLKARLCRSACACSYWSSLLSTFLSLSC